MWIELEPENAEQATQKLREMVAHHNRGTSKKIRVKTAGKHVPMAYLEGDINGFSKSRVESIDGVSKVTRISSAYKGIDRHWFNGDESSPVKTHRDRRIIVPSTQTTPEVIMGKKNQLVYIIGVCTVENEFQTMKTAEQVAHYVNELGLENQVIFRGGLWKPRTTYGSFEGLGWDGLPILQKVKEQFGLPIATEVMDPRYVQELSETIDVLWTGADSWHNQPLLQELGKTNKVVGYKDAKENVELERWLKKSYFIAGARVEGHKHPNMFYIHRGTTNGATDRAKLDPGFMNALRGKVTLPGIVDVSHAAGDHKKVPNYIDVAMQMNPHGLMIEVVHNRADRTALECDGAQALYVRDAFKQIAQYEQQKQ
tara:strand:- start:193 stop:1299 length:1107 start_codon:yes stop_codon:yes gene_type:complete